MRFQDQFNKKVIFTTTPPRSGGMFLFFLLKDYFPDNYDIDIIFSKHNSSFLKIDNRYVTNIMIIRNPVDIACSLLYYATEEIKNKMLSSDMIIEGLYLVLEDFYKNFFISDNNILFSFNNIVNNSNECIKMICKYIDYPYNDNYNANIENLKAMDKKPYNIYTYNFPREIAEEDYIKNKKNVLSHSITKKMILKYNNFIKECTEKNIKGLYG